MTGGLVSHLWQSTWFAAAVALLTLAFRGNRARVRYGLWLSASVKFLVPFSLLIGLGGNLEFRTSIAPRVPLAVEQIAITIAEPLILTPTRSVTPRPRDWGPAALAAVWTCGFVAIVLIRLRGWQRVRAALQASVPLDIASAIEIRSARGLLEPGVVGFVRPVLLLPDGIVERLSTEQLEAVLAHELCHVHRRDNLLSAFHMLVEAIFWFHPLVWWVGARLVEERERACDESVLSLGSEPRTYAEAILGVCELYVESPLACVSGVTGADLKKRIEAIMNNRIGLGLNFAKKLLLTSAGAMALAGPVILGVLIGTGHVPMLRAQAPVPPPAPQIAVPLQTAQAVPVSAAPQPAAVPQPDQQTNRMLTLLLDLGFMTSEEQDRARQAAIQFVQTRLQSADLMSVMVVMNGRPAVVQDYTSDKSLLIPAISGAVSSNDSSPEARLAALEQAVGLLGPIPGRKMMLYYSKGILRQSTPQDQADQAAGRRYILPATTPPEAARVVQAAIQSNVALYAIDTSGAVSAFPLDTALQRRMEEARAKFGNSMSAMSRAYIRYGPPDQVEDRGADGQIWRYNYLDSFRSRTEFEFAAGNNFGGMRINWPPPVATYEGAGFPGRHATVRTYPAGEFQVLTIPMEGLSGPADIVVNVLAVAASRSQLVANARDHVSIAGGVGGATYNFVLQQGSYTCTVTLAEQATGKTYSENIRFEVR
jgi:VWFA-related protein